MMGAHHHRHGAESPGVKSMSKLHRLHLFHNWHLHYNLLPIFADLHNPDGWDHAGLGQASVVFVAQEGDVKFALTIAHWMQRVSA